MTDPIIVGTLLRKKLEAAEDELARLQGVLVTLRADRDRYERRFTTYGNKLREWQELTGFASPSLCEAEITRLRGVVKELQADEIVGNWATLLLPINEDESIDESRLVDEIDVLVGVGVSGIYTNGTAGEFYAQTEEEFDRLHMLLAERCEKAAVPFHAQAREGVVVTHRVLRCKRAKPIRDFNSRAHVSVLSSGQFHLAPPAGALHIRHRPARIGEISLSLSVAQKQ